MHLIILPTQLLPWPKAFLNTFDEIWIIEDAYYFNSSIHPLKLWLHRSSMKEYFDSLTHKKKKYIEYNKSITLPKSFTIAHPTDFKMVNKYKKGTFANPSNFLLNIEELHELDTPVHHAFYKRMRIKFDLLMKNNKPIGGKWSYDSENRKRFPKDYHETNPLDSGGTNKYKSITALSKIPLLVNHLPYPTNRKEALKQLRTFMKTKLDNFGPYEDAISNDVSVGYHSCLSSSLNIGLIIPSDIIRELSKVKAPIASTEGFIRQIMWREFIRMRYVLHGQNNWSYLKQSNKSIEKSWYDASTQIQPLDECIQKVIKYAYTHHIERLMILSNYAVLLRLDHDDTLTWFKNMFIDGYDWVMLNTSMIVCSLSPNKSERYMTRCYINNGSYLKKMGLIISQEELARLKSLYERFIIANKDLCKKDYRLSAQVKRLS